MEAWFFYDKEEGRAVLYKCDDDEEESIVAECRDSIARSGLPEESEDDPVCVQGMVSETIVRLVNAICQGPHGQPLAVLEGVQTKPLLYFLFAPHREDKENPSSLLGLRDEAGNHSVFVIYSKVQGRQILKAHSAKMDREKFRLFMASLERHGLPETSDTSAVRIGDPLACYMNMGYGVMLAQAGVS